MVEHTIRNSLRAAVVGAAALTASITWAQGSQPQTPTSPELATKSAAVAVDDRKIEQFADAYVAVQKIQSEAASELTNNAGDPAKQEQTKAAVEGEMIAAVERTGLKLDEFNGIVQTLTADPDLRAKVVAKIRERAGG